MVKNSKDDDDDDDKKYIIYGFQPKYGLDTTKPPKGRSVMTKQLKEIRRYNRSRHIDDD